METKLESSIRLYPLLSKFNLNQSFPLPISTDFISFSQIPIGIKEDSRSVPLKYDLLWLAGKASISTLWCRRWVDFKSLLSFVNNSNISSREHRFLSTKLKSITDWISYCDSPANYICLNSWDLNICITPNFPLWLFRTIFCTVILRYTSSKLDLRRFICLA